MKNIIFVSEASDPYLKGSSTHIMTYNILAGLSEYAEDLQFIAILEKNSSKKSIYLYYKKMVDTLIPFYTKTNLNAYNRRKYIQLFKTLQSILMSFRYKKIARCVNVKPNSILISHSPSEESILICNEIMKRNKNIKYIQYWSDPLAISGIYPENFNIKRYPMYFIEKSMLKKADKIVYGTKTLMDFQKLMYKNLRDKMYYVDISYSPNNILTYKKIEDRYHFGYLGNYAISTRNIIPLYEAFSNNDKADLFICGKGDIELIAKDNIAIQPRYPQSEINKIEAKLDVLVCLCNHSCIQIPGKIFYQTNTYKIILVILDGKYAGRIRRYLEKFKRFEFCYNNKDSISAAIEKICSDQCVVNLNYVEKLSPRHIVEELCKINDE